MGLGFIQVQYVTWESCNQGSDTIKSVLLKAVNVKKTTTKKLPLAAGCRMDFNGANGEAQQ